MYACIIIQSKHTIMMIINLIQKAIFNAMFQVKNKKTNANIRALANIKEEICMLICYK